MCSGRNGEHEKKENKNGEMHPWEWQEKGAFLLMEHTYW